MPIATNPFHLRQQYRLTNLDRIEILIEHQEGGQNGGQSFVCTVGNLEDTGTSTCRGILFTGRVLLYSKDRRIPLQDPGRDLLFLMHFVYDSVLDESFYNEYDNNIITVTPDNYSTMGFSFDNDSKRWHYQRKPHLLMRERRIARRLVVGHLYNQLSVWISKHRLKRECHFENTALESAIAHLVDSNCIVDAPSANSQDPNLRIKADGMREYEKTLGHGGRYVFIIGPCGGVSEPHTLIRKSVYEPILRKHGYEPDFQEEAEQKGFTILHDIFDKIEASVFLVVDLTDKRANCFVEYGYALALKKKSINFIKLEDGFDVIEQDGKQIRKSKLPFDLGLMKFSTWQDDDANFDEARKEFEKRVNAVSAILADEAFI